VLRFVAGAWLRTVTGPPECRRPATIGRLTGRYGLPVSPVTGAQIAAVADCSRYAAYRAFQGTYGLAPSAYQRQLRLRAARRLLAREVAPAEAAALAGCADQAHLTRWFRRCYGITPGAYRAAGG
jgi:AraC-like DNA-binding protein